MTNPIPCEKIRYLKEKGVSEKMPRTPKLPSKEPISFTEVLSHFKELPNFESFSVINYSEYDYVVTLACGGVTVSEFILKQNVDVKTIPEADGGERRVKWDGGWFLFTSIMEQMKVKYRTYFDIHGKDSIQSSEEKISRAGSDIEDITLENDDSPDKRYM